MGSYYLGLDQGTTGTTALLLDDAWRQAARGHVELRQFYPRPGWVEHDPQELYESLLEATAQALRAAGASAGDIRCIGLDNQGETIVLWDRQSGEPVYPAIVWQDRRTAEEVERLNERCGTLFQRSTGLRLDSYFGATKIRWVLQNVPRAKELLAQHRLAAGSTDTWMLWKLTGGKEFSTDCVTASRTCLMNLQRREWDEELLRVLDIPGEILPEIRENAAPFGVTAPEAFLGARIPIAASIADQQAALLGQACCAPGCVKTTYGTGCFMLMNTGERPFQTDSGLLSTLAWVRSGKAAYALDGGVYIAGAAVQWLRDGLGIVRSAAQADDMALSVADNGGIFFVPAFTGLAAPHWDPYARGTISGITAGATAAHFARAALEAQAYQVRELMTLLEAATGLHIASMRVDGGGTASRFLMQFQADLLGIPVELSEIRETTALGSAYLAAIGMGDLGGVEDTAALWRGSLRYEPAMSSDRREALMEQWRHAVERARR